MNNFTWWIRYFGLRPSGAVRKAAAYLESRGQRFLVEFGVENAVDKAREDWRNRRRKRVVR